MHLYDITGLKCVYFLTIFILPINIFFTEWQQWWLYDRALCGDILQRWIQGDKQTAWGSHCPWLLRALYVQTLL